MLKSQWDADPINRKFLRPDRLEDGLACPLFHQDDGFVAVAVFRGRHYERDHVHLLRSLAPYVRHALHVHLRLSTHATGAAALGALDRLRMGVVLADSQCRLVYANPPGQRILDRADGLSVGSGGFLLAARPELTNRLRALVRHAHDYAERGAHTPGPKNEPTAAGGSLRLPRPSGQLPLEVLVGPLRMAGGSGASRGPTQPSVVIFLSGLGESLDIGLDRLRQLYRLTPAEARLTLRLLEGEDIKAAATAMGISVNTAKTLLRRSFERTGTRRQAELVSLILRGPLGAAGETL
jgi:DNA-binding CsgD family transcriptional regulator